MRQVIGKQETLWGQWGQAGKRAKWKRSRIHSGKERDTPVLELDARSPNAISNSAVPGLRQPKKDSSLEGDHPSPLDSLETDHGTSRKEARFSHHRMKEESLLGPFTGDRSRELARNWREERGWLSSLGSRKAWVGRRW